MNLDDAIKWADVFGAIQSDPPDGVNGCQEPRLFGGEGALQGEANTLARILKDADAVLETIEPENDDEAERLSDLRMAIAYALAPAGKPSPAQQFGMDLGGGAAR